MKALSILLAVFLTTATDPSAYAVGGIQPSVADYHSIQEALDAHRGRMVYLPPGDYEITDKLRIRGDHGGLFGPGRIIQTHAERPIIEIEKAAFVQLRDLTLTRPAGKTDTQNEALVAINCTNLVLDNLRVLDNRSCAPAIGVRQCRDVQIRHCLVQNYVRVSIDDRTASPDWGYAFRCIDGTGIGVQHSSGVLIEGNRIVEHTYRPTPELQRQHQLGQFVKRNAKKGAIANQQAWDAQYVDAWHQGSAILVSAPDDSDCTQILGNYVENAGQGIDIHADHVIVSQNIVNNAHIGMKAMHGSRNVLILGNQFLKNDLWAIGLMPGAAAHAARLLNDGKRLEPANVDGGSIIANNIISDFGYGHSHWLWQSASCCPIRLDGPQKPDNPPLRDVIVQGNVVYDTGREQGLVDGALKVLPPRYKYAVLLFSGRGGPQGVQFSNNIFHPGTAGVCNVDLGPLSLPPTK